MVKNKDSPAEENHGKFTNIVKLKSMFPKYQHSKEKSREESKKIILRQLAIEIKHIKTYDMQQKQF